MSSRRNYNVIVSSKRRRFDEIIALLLRHVSVGKLSLHSINTTMQSCLPSLHWRHIDHDGVSNHQPHGCLLNRLFGRRSKKTSKLRVTSLCAGNSLGPVNSPYKGPVTRKMFPFDDVIMFRKKNGYRWYNLCVYMYFERYVYNLSYVVTTTQYIKMLYIFKDTFHQNIKSCPEIAICRNPVQRSLLKIMLKQCVYSKIYFGHQIS